MSLWVQLGHYDKSADEDYEEFTRGGRGDSSSSPPSLRQGMSAV